MNMFEGLRLVPNPHVPADRIVMLSPHDPTRATILYRDRYALMTALFWARVGPRLDALAEECRRRWEATS